MYNTFDSIQLREDHHVHSLQCKTCGFQTPGAVGIWGKDISEMESEHIDYLHKRLNRE